MTTMDDRQQWMTAAMHDETQQSTKITIYTQVVEVVVVVGIHCVYCLVVVLKEERGVKRIEVVY
jgi:hypothetical protein